MAVWFRTYVVIWLALKQESSNVGDCSLFRVWWAVVSRWFSDLGLGGSILSSR